MSVNRTIRLARVLLVVVPLLALTPLVRMSLDWMSLSRMLQGPVTQPSYHGFDWVLWQEDDGVVYASYVHPRGPAAEAGIREGDVFFMMDYQQFFSAEALKGAIGGIPPGATRTYSVQRGDDIVEADVTLTRYPTFLYPLSSTLWQFSIWGFLVGAFFHLLGLVIVGPLAVRSGKARFSLLVILVSSLWIFGNLSRLLLMELLGPPVVADGHYDRLCQFLTSVGLFGWIGFPALLLHKVVVDAPVADRLRRRRLHLLVYLPALLLGAGAFAATVAGNVGPITLDALVAPILFYACCYVAAAAALALLLRTMMPELSEPLLGGWNRLGSGVMFVIAVVFGLSVLGVVPLLGAVTDAVAGWLIVGAQLLSIVPVVLVSEATLKHGRVDRVLARGLGYVLVFGLFFFAFVGGLSLLDPYTERVGTSGTVVAGLYAVLLLFLFERIARRTRGLVAGFFTSDRESIYQAVNRFPEQMRAILCYETLAQRTIELVGDAFGARSAAIYLRPEGESGPWYSAVYHPEPPYLTERVVGRLWPHLRSRGEQDAAHPSYDDTAVWARNPEVNERPLPADLHALLEERGAVIVVPVVGDDGTLGLIALGPKRRRRAVYNLEDVELLRSLSVQLALSVERLNLVERERTLVRESAEAQLVALRAQINPHFLFNALNTIVALIEERPEEAEATVEHLAAIFRHILQTGSRPFVALEEEMRLVEHYLTIEKARFGNSLQIEQAMDPSLAAHPVPAFAVQTLVENAVKHGLARRRGGGAIRLAASVVEEGDFVEIVVSDTGAGIQELFGHEGEAATEQAFFGIGLRNVAARLEQLYERSDLLRLASSREEGTTVRLLLPLPQASTPRTDRPRQAATSSM